MKIHNEIPTLSDLFWKRKNFESPITLMLNARKKSTIAPRLKQI